MCIILELSYPYALHGSFTFEASQYTVIAMEVANAKYTEYYLYVTIPIQQVFCMMQDNIPDCLVTMLSRYRHDLAKYVLFLPYIVVTQFSMAKHK